MKLENKQKENPGGPLLMGLASVGVSGAASGAIVEIDLIGNSVTAGGGNQIYSDLVGDGANLFSFSASFTFQSVGAYLSGRLSVASTSNLNALSSVNGGYFRANGVVGGNSVASPEVPGGSVESRIVLQFSVSSLGIGLGDVTGVLTATSGGQGLTRGVTLDSLFFNDDGAALDVNADLSSASLIGTVSNPGGTGAVFTAVPEPSSLALLALGAGGILTRRQRKRNENQ